MKQNIAIFASGSGSNAENLIQSFLNHPTISIKIIFSNNPKAYVIERAKKWQLPLIIFNREEFYNTDIIIKELVKFNIDYIVLAGFLWLIPVNIISKYTNKIINIHPSLLPKYGGKGMYGLKVHEEVVRNKDSTTGITIHLVNENYDDGLVLFQENIEVIATDTAEIIAEKVHELEYKYLPTIVEKTILGNIAQ